MRDIPPGVNDTRRPDPRRDACDALAEHLATDDGLRTARLASRVGSPRPPASPSPSRLSPSPPRPISIWTPREQDGALVFERPEPLPLGDHFAARRRILAEKPAGTRRVVFLGESVAAGYLYAPHWTPAEVLELQLREIDAGFEVVDLARTNETLDGLATTAEAARQLAPDALVIFAGNNWNLLETPEISPFAPSVGARQGVAAALAEGLDGPVRLARERLGERVENSFGRIADLARALAIPVAALVPEVNLADWESRQPVPWLPGAATPRWWRSYDEALAALADGRHDEAKMAAEAMVAIGGGVVGTAYRLLARLAAARGDDAELRRFAEAEIDHTPYATLALLDAPRASPAVRARLVRAAMRHGFSTVDLPSVFDAHTGACPGRRLFLDYCHLTSEGVRVAMAATASAVLASLDAREIPWRDLTTVDVDPHPEVEALARLGAAVHGAHRLLTVDGERPILRYWLRASLGASPKIADTMLDLALARATPAPAILAASQGRQLDTPHRLGFPHGWRWDGLDAELVGQIIEVLEDRDAFKDRGRPVRREIIERLVAGHGIPPGGVDLLTPRGMLDPLERFFPETMPSASLDGYATHRAPEPRSRFVFVKDGGSAAVLDLVVRLPTIDGWDGRRSGRLEVRVAGRCVERLEVGESWSRHRVNVPADLLRPGFQRVELHWPELPPAGDAALEAARRRLELGREATIHPIFGEVAELRAQDAKT